VRCRRLVGEHSSRFVAQFRFLTSPQNLHLAAAKMGSGSVNSTRNDAWPSRVPKPGVRCPAVNFLLTSSSCKPKPNTIPTCRNRALLTGLVILGTNAETLLLTHEERTALLATARKAVGPGYPLMAGVGGHSAKQALEYIADAYKAGANYALVLPAAYFGKQTTPSVITRFYHELRKSHLSQFLFTTFPRSAMALI
jgi:4-hydroxy-2-oxoglutarate aldolase